ncbi:MAG TPA: DNA translocase FtsK [Candidatus Paceibacterota bacterium]|nr:DNA translocase FtsK [Candidatus Paceibacterota bacterium]
MAKKNGNGARNGSRNGGRKDKAAAAATERRATREPQEPRLHSETKNSIWAISFLCVAIILILAGFAKAGPAGAAIYQGLHALFGWGYFILPTTLFFAAVVLLSAGRRRIVGMTLLGSVLLMLSFLALIELASPGNGGWLGLVFGSLRTPFGTIAASVINVFILVAAILVTANVPLKIKMPHRAGSDETDDDEPILVTGTDAPEESETGEKKDDEKKSEKEEKDADMQDIAVTHQKDSHDDAKPKKFKAPVFKNYVPPPLSLLKSESSKPTTGDLYANANIIKRTLDSFGIPVEMGEINVGPAVTRYTLKPAEGVKLSRITALNSDLALALAAHPIRIEAPIPGKSLVGIEVPNKAAALVRLGSLMNYPDFTQAGPLGFALGRDVSGEPIFANIEKMPHMLVAGATGSGKSILVHALLTSLLYKNSPQTLKMALIDPKRVELSIYDGIPHLISPVITDNKKAVGVLKWAISEMERRYELLQKAGSRDIKSYNGSHPSESLPYVLVGIDEMADLMTSYGREVEGSIVRLAQMARATGIHLLLATQRPSVEVITGLIKANITSRVALQVASQIDSRTIIDTAGAEKLLGHGDLLFISAELSKPKRIQGAYISEEEIRAVADFVRENNKVELVEREESDIEKGGPANLGIAGPTSFDAFMEGEANGGDEDDDLFDEALATVLEAKKASASLLQRRLKVGYARAARLLDLMESGGYIGPGEGAKPRDVNIEKIESRLT